MIANSFCCYRKGAQKAWYEKYTKYIKLGNKTGLVGRWERGLLTGMAVANQSY